MSEQYDSQYEDDYRRDDRRDDRRNERRDEKRDDGEKSIFLKILLGIWAVLLFPFKLLMNFAHLINEIRMFVLSIVTLVVVFVIVIVLIVAFKPPFAWDPLKSFLNADIKVEESKEIKVVDIYAKINEISTTPGEIRLSDAEVTQLFRSSGLINGQSRVYVYKDILEFTLNIDSQDKPLWLLVRAQKASDGNVKIADVGFKRFWFPGFVSGAANSSFSSITDLLAKQNGKDSAVVLFNQLLDIKLINKDLLLSKVEFVDGSVVLKYTVIIE